MTVEKSYKWIGVLSFLLLVSHEVDADADWYVGVAVPFQGVGIYETQDQKVLVWNLTPFSIERPIKSSWGGRFSVYTVYSTPKPKRIQEFEFNLEFPFYFGNDTRETLLGWYVGPMAMVQFQDQDSDATLGGPGVTVGYRGQLTQQLWFRIGSYFAYHTHLFGPTEKLREITGGSTSGGLFMGLTMFEVGKVF